MNPKIRTKFKEVLSKSIPNNSKLRYLSYLPQLETWRRKHGERYQLFTHRYEMYDYLNAEVLKGGPITYLEFGVRRGDSIKYWASINTHSESRFWGFDTFSGLPEAWDVFTEVFDQGAFDTEGEVPDVKDERVSFVKGLFQHTLSNFLREQKITSQLVVHNDSDLYSSTLYVLSRCNDILLPGTIIVFDEFSSILHEFRALQDYCSSYMRDYLVMAATKSSTNYYSKVAVRMR